MKNYLKSFIMALSMFTILPVPYIEWDEKSSRNMMKLYPAVGAVVGIIYALCYMLLNILQCPIALKSAVILIIPFILSGMIHLDGYCDVCDAILSRRSKEEKLRILKDSRIGAFAVAALFMLFFLQYGAVFSILQKYNIGAAYHLYFDSIFFMLIFIPIVSRSLAGYFLLSRITIKESTLGTYFKKGTNKGDIAVMIISIITVFAACICSLGIKYGIVILVMIICAYLCTVKCIKEFGGVSGDVAGFILVVCECSSFIALALI